MNEMLIRDTDTTAGLDRFMESASQFLVAARAAFTVLRPSGDAPQCYAFVSGVPVFWAEMAPGGEENWAVYSVGAGKEVLLPRLPGGAKGFYHGWGKLDAVSIASFEGIADAASACMRAEQLAGVAEGASSCPVLVQYDSEVSRLWFGSEAFVKAAMLSNRKPEIPNHFPDDDLYREVGEFVRPLTEAPASCTDEEFAERMARTKEACKGFRAKEGAFPDMFPVDVFYDYSRERQARGEIWAYELVRLTGTVQRARRHVYAERQRGGGVGGLPAS